MVSDKNEFIFGDYEDVLILVVMEILCKSDEQSQARLSYAMTQPKFSKEIWSQT